MWIKGGKSKWIEDSHQYGQDNCDYDNCQLECECCLKAFKAFK